MVRFVTYWIERGMEDPAERERRAKEYFSKVQEGADRVRHEWSLPIFPKGYWNLPSFSANSRDRAASAAARPLSSYDACLADMDDKRLRDESRKN